MLKVTIYSALLLILVGGFTPQPDAVAAGADNNSEGARAILAGGCFWCMESALEAVAGVEEVISGYTGGEQANPTYKQVSSGSTGHTEAVEVHFNPKVVSYAELLQVFWRNMDPTDAAGQFVDRGSQYRSVIFYLNDEQRRIAEKSKADLAASGRFDKPLVTEITPVGTFYRAEEYHQDYYAKKPLRYWLYTNNSGRKEFKKKYWGDEKADD